MSEANSTQSAWLSTSTNTWTCSSCGALVPFGLTHACPSLGSYSWPVTWHAPATPTVQRFRGSVKKLDDLPKLGYHDHSAKTGDAYYVDAPDLLVVRTPNGWHHFDR